MTFTPSRFQQDIFEHTRNGTGHSVIKAGPGSGKTTTIVEALKYVPYAASTRLVAFNSHIIEAMKERAPDHVDVCTTHSLGLSTLRSYFPKVKVDDKGLKLTRLLDKYIPIPPYDEIDRDETKRLFRKQRRVKELVAYAKYTLFDYRSPEAVEACAEHYEVELNGDDLIETTQTLTAIMDECKKNVELVDFDDMIWLPVVHRLPTKKKTNDLFIDETQDLNAAQIEMLLRSITEDGRITAVGDPLQSLYGFRGADVEAIPNIIARLNATILPLSISYRLPKSHVENVRALMPELEAAPDAIEGIIETLPIAKMIPTLRPGDGIICRTNAPLVRAALATLARGLRTVIRGKEFGKGLQALLERFNATTIPDLLFQLKEYYEIELERLTIMNKWAQIGTLEDRVESLMAIISSCSSIFELTGKIAAIFDDRNAAVTYSTIHGAKGLEWDRVFIMRPDLIPHPRAKSPWQLKQEVNVKFVSETRSRRELYYVLGEV